MKKLDLIKAAVEEYCGSKPKKVSTANDPLSPGWIAIRAYFSDKHCDFLVNESEGISWEHLEEAEFETWPPKGKEENMYKLSNMMVSSL